MNRRRRQGSGFSGLVRSGKLQPVLPTTDTGYKTYGAGRLFLPAGTNYCTNPAMVGDANSDNVPDLYSLAASVAGTVTKSIETVVIPGVGTTKAVHIQYTATAGDSAGSIYLEVARMTAGAAGGPAIGSAYVKGTITGTCTTDLFLDLISWTAVPGYLGRVNATAATLSASTWTRLAAVYSSLPASHALLDFRIGQVTSIDNGDVIDLWIALPQVELSSVLTPCFDGTSPDCAWTGAANASTSTRGASSLTSWSPLIGASQGTVAMRWVPLFAGNDSGDHILFDQGRNDGAGIEISKAGNNKLYISLSDGGSALCGVDQSAAVGSINALIARFAMNATLDIMHNGTAAAQTAHAKTPTITATCRFGMRSAGTFPAQGCIGPVAISPSRITDAETLTLDAMLTAGATGLDLARWAIREGLGGTLILPLEQDSVGYVVQGGIRDNYTYTGVAATIDTGYRTYV